MEYSRRDGIEESLLCYSIQQMIMRPKTKDDFNEIIKLDMRMFKMNVIL